jgi:methylamine---glutamate N-methyltransferase subunit B
MIEYSLDGDGVRKLNQRLHDLGPGTNELHWMIRDPMGAHSIAVGLDAPVTVEIDGHVGFYCAGMNKQAES